MKMCLRTIVIAVMLACAFSADASASPLTLATPGIAGTLDGKLGDSNPTTELGIAQQILDFVGLGVVSPATPTQNYRTSTVFDYSGTLSNPNQSAKNAYLVPASFIYALAKYDGPNAGYVLYHLPTFVAPASGYYTLPQYPANFWTNDPTKWAISHFTTFNTVTAIAEVDDGGTTLGLLAIALCGLAIAWRRVGNLYESAKTHANTIL